MLMMQMNFPPLCFEMTTAYSMFRILGTSSIYWSTSCFIVRSIATIVSNVQCSMPNVIMMKKSKSKESIDRDAGSGWGTREDIKISLAFEYMISKLNSKLISQLKMKRNEIGTRFAIEILLTWIFHNKFQISNFNLANECLLNIISQFPISVT